MINHSRYRPPPIPPDDFSNEETPGFEAPNNIYHDNANERSHTTMETEWPTSYAPITPPYQHYRQYDHMQAPGHDPASDASVHQGEWNQENFLQQGSTSNDPREVEDMPGSFQNGFNNQVPLDIGDDPYAHRRNTYSHTHIGVQFEPITYAPEQMYDPQVRQRLDQDMFNASDDQRGADQVLDFDNVSWVSVGPYPRPDGSLGHAHGQQELRNDRPSTTLLSALGRALHRSNDLARELLSGQHLNPGHHHPNLAQVINPSLVDGDATIGLSPTFGSSSSFRQPSAGYGMSTIVGNETEYPDLFPADTQTDAVMTEPALTALDESNRIPVPTSVATDDTLRCPSCDSEFTGTWKRSNYARHKRSKHRGVVKMWPCGAYGCEASFKRTDARLKHYRRKHPEFATSFVPRPRNP